MYVTFKRSNIIILSCLLLILIFKKITLSTRTNLKRAENIEHID